MRTVSKGTKPFAFKYILIALSLTYFCQNSTYAKRQTGISVPHLQEGEKRLPKDLWSSNNNKAVPKGGREGRKRGEGRKERSSLQKKAAFLGPLVL